MFKTNEKLAKKFKSQFDLVNYAIKLAENMIKSGRASRVRTPIQNRAFQILAEINIGLDRFDDIVEKPRDEQHRDSDHSDRRSHFSGGRSVERERTSSKGEAHALTNSAAE
jgi:hypothetical protein